MIKRLKKKAFTLVELLVVIAILAILATAGIVGYTSFTKKAEISNDNSLVAELNNYVVAAKVSKDFNTVSEVRDELVPSGIDLAKLTPSAKNHGYSYGFDIKDDKFVLLEGTSLAEGYSVDKTIDVFVLVKNEAKAIEYMNAGYSVYLQAGYDKTTVNASKGVDVGENTSITTVNYANTAEQTVVIRTNGGNLTINAASDTVKHYGEGQVLDIQAIAGSSYHEFGHFPKATIAQGRMVVEDKGQVEIVNVTGSGVVLDEVGTGSIELCFASSNENIPTGTANVEATVAAIVLDDIVARTENGAYTTLTAALNNLGTSKTLFIVADFSETFTATSGTAMYSISTDLTFDGQGHTINATFIINNEDTKIFMDVVNAKVSVKNLNIVGVGVKYIFVADDDSEMTFDNLNIIADNAGISAANAHAVARNCTFRFNKGEHTRNDHEEAWAPVSAQFGGTLELFDCVLTSSDGYGMLIWPSGGTLEATRCSITSAKGYAVSWARNGAGTSTRSDSIVRVNNCTLEGSTSCEAKYNGTSAGGTEAYIYKDGVLVATTVSE